MGTKQLGLSIAVLLLTNIGFVQAQSVGVGTSTPVAKLHVEVPAGYTAPLLQVNVQGNTPYLIVLPNGNVGIGVATPSEALDVSGNIRFTGALMPAGSAGNAGQVLLSQGPGNAPIWIDTASFGGDNWGSQVAVTQAPITGDGTSSNPIALQSGTAAGDILVWDGSQWQIQPFSSTGAVNLCGSIGNNYLTKWTGIDLCNSQVYDDGTNVGIGTTTPSYKLDVQGTGRFTGTLTIGAYTLPNVDGTNGQVLMTDGAGNVSWQNVPGDNWGTQTAVTSGPIIGNGTSGNPITFASGTAAGNIWQWDGTAWQQVSPPWDSVCAGLATNNLVKWTGTNLCGTQVYDDGTNVGFFTTTPQYPVHIILNYGGSFGQALLYVEDTSSTGGDGAAIRGIKDRRDYWGYGGYFKGGYKGVYATVTPTGSNSYYGVHGYVSGGTGTNYAGYFYASTGGSLAYGVYGGAYSSATSGATVYGGRFSATSTGTSNSYGVYAIAGGDPTAAWKIGVYGRVADKGSGHWAMYGFNSADSGTAIVGVGNNRTTIYTLVEGSGVVAQSEEIGLFAKADATTTTAKPIAAIYASADNDPASTTNPTPWAYIANYPTDPNTPTTGGYFDDGQGTFAYVAATVSGTQYKINGTGNVSTIIKAPDGTRRNMFAPEAPEIFFMDLGIAQLKDGRARVQLDPIFANTIYVSDEKPLRVFTQVMGLADCGTVGVVDYGKDYFEVQATKPCDAQFTWMVVANRADEYDENGKLISRNQDVRFPLSPSRMPRMKERKVLAPEAPEPPVDPKKRFEK